MRKQKFAIAGMTCSACSSHIEKNIAKLSGMEQVSVNLLTNSMQTVYNEEICSEKIIIETVEKAGYGAYAVQAESEPKEERRKTGSDENREMKTRLIISIVFMLLLMLVSMHHMLFMWLHIPLPQIFMQLFHGNENALTFAFTQLLLTLPILYVNRKYFQNGGKALLHLSPNMDSLIAVGSGAALIYGIIAIYGIGYGLGHNNMALVSRYAQNLYFESAGMILALITVGKYLEARSKGKTGEAITKLMDLSPKMAIRLSENGEEMSVPTEQLVIGDIFIVKPGANIPVDGIVLEGNSSVNEAAITGESIPIEKNPGDSVVAATANKAGRLICRAVKVGDDTTLAQIIRLVEEASASKAPIAKMADKVAGIFVPIVMGIALLTFCIWIYAGGSLEMAVSCAISVLVISCPCALGLATPVAIMVGTGVGARNGILIRSGDALQRAKEIQTVVLDKTGTITEGAPKVTDVVCYSKRLSEEQVIALAAAIEKPSEHPLSEAIVEKAKDQVLAIPKSTDFQAVFGKGVQAKVEKDLYLAGNLTFMTDNDVMLTEGQKNAMDAFAHQGKTPLLLAREKELLAIIAVADTIKATSEKAIAQLRQQGMDTIMLTGDNEQTAQAVKRALGIHQVIAEVLPEDKERQIRLLQQQGRVVAMIGDGINDAPALAAADVGIAIGAGTDVAIDSADIILMKSQLTDAITAIRLSKAVIRNIKQNLFWAFFYNTIGIPLAAGVLYPVFGITLNPMFGAAAMSLSSLFVVGNALRLRNFKCMDAKDKNKQEKGETKMKKRILIEGMSCEHCTARVQKALETVAGVITVEMRLEEKMAEVTVDAGVKAEALKAVVEGAGYQVISIQ